LENRRFLDTVTAWVAGFSRRSHLGGRKRLNGLDALKGHDFSRAENFAESVWALAPEGILAFLFEAG
jgi:hypothetical protein